MKEKLLSIMRMIARFCLYIICIPFGAIAAACMLALDFLED